MQRSKFPYSVRSSAKVIRHAVSIDERRAKFRSDLMSAKRVHGAKHVDGPRRHHQKRDQKHDGGVAARNSRRAEQVEAMDRFRRPSHVRQSRPVNELPIRPGKGLDGDHLKPRRNSRGSSQQRAPSPVSSVYSNVSQFSMPPPRLYEDDDELDEAAEQDLEELWFPGCHADLGGGWPISPDEELPLSHGPLVWMVREAERAGLDFDREMMANLKCGEDFQGDWTEPDNSISTATRLPTVQVTSSPSPNLFSRSHSEKQEPGWAQGAEPEAFKPSEFNRCLHIAATKGRIHDCLKFKNGLTSMSVISWRMMEYLPFRRMDLKPDGSWAAISFP